MLSLVPDLPTLCAECERATESDLCAPCARVVAPMVDACRALAEQLYVPDGSRHSVRIDLENDGPGAVTASARLYGEHARMSATKATARAAYTALRDALCDALDEQILSFADTVMRARAI